MIVKEDKDSAVVTVWNEEGTLRVNVSLSKGHAYVDISATKVGTVLDEPTLKEFHHSVSLRTDLVEGY
jgi:hypothetical protein